MLVLGAVGVGLVDARPQDNWGNIVGPLLVLLNLPVTPVALLILILPEWAIGIVIPPVVWLAWYGIIRFLEWRSYCGAPLSITNDPTSSPPPQS